MWFCTSWTLICGLTLVLGTVEDRTKNIYKKCTHTDTHTHNSSKTKMMVERDRRNCLLDVKTAKVIKFYMKEEYLNMNQFILFFFKK